MTEVLHRVAETARSWGRRDDLSPGDRYMASQMGDLAAYLAGRPFPHDDDLASLRILSCRLCRRIGAANCFDEAQACSMGFAAA